MSCPARGAAAERRPAARSVPSGGPRRTISNGPRLPPRCAHRTRLPHRPTMLQKHAHLNHLVPRRVAGGGRSRRRLILPDQGEKKREVLYSEPKFLLRKRPEPRVTGSSCLGSRSLDAFARFRHPRRQPATQRRAVHTRRTRLRPPPSLTVRGRYTRAHGTDTGRADITASAHLEHTDRIAVVLAVVLADPTAAGAVVDRISEGVRRRMPPPITLVKRQIELGRQITVVG